MNIVHSIVYNTLYTIYILYITELGDLKLKTSIVGTYFPQIVKYLEFNLITKEKIIIHFVPKTAKILYKTLKSILYETFNKYY